MENLELHGAPLALMYLALGGTLIAAPALLRGFRRRGTGTTGERNFVIQRAPQLAVGANTVILLFAFEFIELTLGNGKPAFGAALFNSLGPFAPLLSVAPMLPPLVASTISWCGVVLFATGWVFLILGWYSLGSNLSTDAELLPGQTLCTTGVYGSVMHPVYSGVVQAFVGASIVALSPACAIATVALLAPLFLRRALYEEDLLRSAFGQSYVEYGNRLKWRRFIPALIPAGF